ncbi:MAG: D-glycero-beta-D-manno-heptose 1,7-bisphosphate 7-phosphatase [Gammaproteobacteria bacterium]
MGQFQSNPSRLILLDRDGVINEDSDNYIRSVAEWQPIPGSLEAIAKLAQHGYRVVVLTNQSGIARGYYSVTTLNAMHHKMHRMVGELGGEIEAVLFCPHGPDDGCTCRKPLPGMFETVAKRLGINLSGVPAVGDSLRDLQAARAAGADPVLVRTGKGLRTLAKPDGLSGIPIYDDLASFADDLLLSNSA